MDAISTQWAPLSPLVKRTKHDRIEHGKPGVWRG